jgi:hypothetical protein
MLERSLLRIIARAHDIQERLSQNTQLTVHDIAGEEGVTAAYIYTVCAENSESAVLVVKTAENRS